VAQLIERFPLQDPAQFADPFADLAGTGRFLLVEQSRYDARQRIHLTPRQVQEPPGSTHEERPA
jgi:hypothetical protein